MTTKKTILSEKELNLVENLISEYGVIVNFEQIFSQLKDNLGRQGTRNLVSKVVKNGWLVRIKKGVYYITTLESRGVANISEFIIAQTLETNSYISFESALQYHKVFDLHLRVVASINLKRKKEKEIQKTIYKFIKTTENNYYGWEEVQIENRMVKVATLEKAILDILSFKRTVHSIDFVLEKLKEYGLNFDWEKLNDLSGNQSATVQRILGFLLDKTGIDSEYLHKLVEKSKNSSSYMTKDSDLFNAKWRLYYHNHFK
jgi:predicted transcriptional regulator of viral defense system